MCQFLFISLATYLGQSTCSSIDTFDKTLPFYIVNLFLAGKVVATAVFFLYRD